MSVGTYGIVRSSDVSINDIEIFYNFRSSREAQATEMFSLDANEVMSELQIPTNDQLPGRENLLEGLYNLTLPATVFNALGIYTLYIKPKTINVNIVDCGVLASLPTIKGIVIDGNLIDSNLRSNNALQGYKVEYINNDGTKLRNVVRYVVSSNKVVPISSNIGNTSQRSTRYSFDDTGNLIFLQLTPSSSSSLKPNAVPFIGVSGQDLIISNSFFSPICLEIEMVENTVDTLTYLVAGEQIKNAETGELTMFDKNRNITKQFNLYTVKDDITNTDKFEVKELKDNISPIDFDEITDI